MYSQEIKIPKERIAVLIGKEGLIKRQLQKETETKITVNKEGDVLIEGEDSLKVYSALQIIKAISRGFNPKIAQTLLNEQYIMDVLNIKDFTGKSENKFRRRKARVIGTKGKAWKLIEQLTDTNISVYGKTVAIIGLTENVILAKQAVEKLLRGAPHSHVYIFLEEKKINKISLVL